MTLSTALVSERSASQSKSEITLAAFMILFLFKICVYDYMGYFLQNGENGCFEVREDQCAQIFIQAHFCKNLGGIRAFFLAKIWAKSGQN